MIEPIGLRARRGPVVLAAQDDETSTAAAIFASRIARRAGVDLRVGTTSASSARIARELDATLIVVSAMPDRLNPERMAARRASRLIATSACAVASVSPALVALPRMCVAAMDFSAASIRAVQLALLMLDDCGTLILVHVRPTHDLSSAQHTARNVAMADDISDRLDRLRVQLADYAPSGAVVETQMESGGIVDQVLSVARAVDADLVAIGVHPTRVRLRLFHPGSAVNVLRRAPCTVLASPVPRIARTFGGDAGSRYWTRSPEWSELAVPI